MRVLATYNIKGGVGKTTTTVNLAYLAAQEGYRTLVWDLDPQGAASYLFRIKPKIKGGGEDLVHRRRDLDRLIKGTDYENLDLLPADFSYRYLDLYLDQTKKPTRRLFKLLKPLLQNDGYDLIFLDCAPSISLVSENIFVAADALIIPMLPATLSLRTWQQLHEFVVQHGLSELQLLPFFSMVDRRKKLHRDVQTLLPRRYPLFLRSAIPYSSDVERMGVYRAALGSFAAGTAAYAAYRALWHEIVGRLDDNSAEA